MILVAAKLAGSLFIYYSMNVPIQGTFWSNPIRVYNWEQNNVLLQYARTAGNWPYLFMGWDSAWYLSIITKGYAFSSQSYTFLPGLPIFGTLFNLIIHNALLATAICVFLFGVFWVPFYQLLAEYYVSRRSAFVSALLLSFSPYLFVFTTVVYGEGLFLFFTLTALYLFKKRKMAVASVLAGTAALTRIMGVLVILPMLYDSIKSKSKNRTRNIVMSALPAVALVAWFGYCLFSAGDLFAPIHTTEWSGLYTVPSFLLRDLPQMGLSAFLEIPLQSWPALQFWLSPMAMVLALAVPPFLIYRVAKIDGALAVYSLAGYVGLVVFGAIVSAPRFVSVLFPIWLPITAKMTLDRKQKVIVLGILVAFFVISLDMWISFLNGQFIS